MLALLQRLNDVVRVDGLLLEQLLHVAQIILQPPQLVKVSLKRIVQLIHFII